MKVKADLCCGWERQMQKKTGKRKKSKQWKSKKSYLIIGLLACVFLAGASITVYSKYYKTGYNQGMAIASGFYFSSNYMYEEEAINNYTIKELAKSQDGKLVHEELINKLISAVSKEAWNTNGSSISYTFNNIEVRNYANSLLFNDEELNVSYQVEFALLDANAGAEYKVRKKGTGTYTSITNDGNGNLTTASFQGKLKGGELSEDVYELQVTRPQTGEYTPARILIMAYPEGDAFSQNPRKIAGIVKAEYNQAEMEIIDQKFTIEDELEDSTWQERVKKESAFIYQLKTTGGFYVEGDDNMLQKIKIKWNPDVLALNENDKYKNESGTQYDAGLGEMIIETAPYSSIKFVFFKKEGFGDWVDGQSSMDKFKGLVSVEKVAATP